MATLWLDGAWAKLDRAEGHLKTLQAQIAVFLDSDAYSVREHFHSNRRRYSLSIDIRQQPPLLLSVVLGDLIHNLRSALDHLAHQLVVANGKQATRSTQFPIFIEEPVSGKPRAKWRSMVKGMPGPVIDAIKRIQPYTAGNLAQTHRLAVLASLSNQDKHRLPVASIAVIAKPNLARQGLAAVHDAELEWAGIASGKALQHGEHVAWGHIRPTGPHPKVEMHGKFPVEIAFGDAQARLAELVDLCNQTRLVVALLEVAFIEAI